MKKLFLKSFALVAMLLCGLTASAVDWSGYAWLGNGSGNAEYTDTYKITLPLDGKGTNGNAVNIQKPGFASAPGIYCTFPAGISSVSVASKIDGAGVILYMTAFTAVETEVTVTYAGGTSTFTVYNKNGSLDNINFALASNGAKAWASSGTAANAIDGNKGTRWESEHKVDPQWFVVNLGQQREFNTVQLLWERAYGKSFTIDYSTDSTKWTNFATIADQTLSGFPYLQTLTVDNPVTAQYVRFVGTARGDANYGYSFWEFQVLKATEDVLTTVELEAAAAIAKVNEGVALTVTGKNQNGAVMSEYGKVEYTVSPADAGAVVDGKYVPAKQGPATIVAAVGEIKSEEVSVFGYEGDNVALSTNITTDNKVIAQSDKGEKGTDAFYAVDGNEGNIWQGSATDGTAEDDASRTYDAWFVLDLGAYYDINLITIKFEGACSDAYHVDASATNNGTDWVVMHNFAKTMGTNGHTDYIYGENLTNNTSVRFVRFWSTKASTRYGMKIYEMKVLASEGSAPADDVKPVMKNATLVSNTYNSAVIAVEATDNMGVESYKVVDATNAFDANYVAVDGKITVTGLTPGTTYNLAISAIDLVGNVSEEAKSVQVVIPMYSPAAAPVHAQDKVRSIYSDTYTSALAHHDFAKNSWSGIQYKEITFDENNHYLLYTTNNVTWITWGENNDGNNAIIAAEGYNDGTHKGLDLSVMDYLHVDIFVDANCISGEVFINDESLAGLGTLEGGKWNSLNLSLESLKSGLTEEKKEGKINSTRWIKFVGLNGVSMVIIDNVYAWKNGTSTAVDANEVATKVSKMIENGQIVIIREGVKYDVTGRAIER